MEQLLKELRDAGWAVGVHNDYVIDGRAMTFWLLTHRSGLYVKGEAATDRDALTICAQEAMRVFAPSP